MFTADESCASRKATRRVMPKVGRVALAVAMQSGEWSMIRLIRYSLAAAISRPIRAGNSLAWGTPMTIDSSVLLKVSMVVTAATFWRRVSRPIVFTIFCFSAFYTMQGIAYAIAFQFTGKSDVFTSALEQARGRDLSYAISDVASLIIGAGLAYLLARAMPRHLSP